jgi:hypothetical protein
MTFSVEEVLDRICPADCPACGAELPRPGVECAACGELPGLLRAEAAEQLAVPGALAAKAAGLHRREARRLLDAQIGELLEADRVVYIDQLQQAADQAGAALTAAIARRDQAEAGLKAPGAAEKRAADALAEAAGTQRDYDLQLRKDERYKRGTKTIVEARRKAELAGEEVVTRRSALTAATAAREEADRALSAAEAEAEQLTRARDHAAWRLAHPGNPALSIDSLNALAVPVLGIAKEVSALRLDRPAYQFTPADVNGDIRIAFAVAIAAQLGMLTGLMSAEHTAGIADGRKQAEAEHATRPKVLADRVFPPGVLPR